MTVDTERRALLAAFLERLAVGEIDRQEWQEVIVNHYHDERLECIRRDCVRLVIQNDEMSWSAEELHQINFWIDELHAFLG